MRIIIDNMIIVLLLAIASTYAEFPSIELDQLHDKMNTAYGGVFIVRTAFKGINSVYEYVNPNEAEELRKALINQHIAIIKAEESLLNCVTKNAYNYREKNQLPSNCSTQATSYAEIAGFEKLNALKLDFNTTLNDLPSLPESQKNQKGMSTTNKVIIGGIIIIGGTGAFLISAPILLPGTAVAAKATAITTAIKAGAATASTKLMVTGTAAKGAALSAIDTAKECKKIFDTLSLADKMSTIAVVANSTNFIAPYIYEGNKEELERLLKDSTKKSLRVRIIEEHFNKP